MHAKSYSENTGLMAEERNLDPHMRVPLTPISSNHSQSY